MAENHVVDRRQAICTSAAAAGALALGAGGAVLVNAATPEKASAAGDASAQYGFMVKLSRCVECGECVEACRLWNRIPASAPARRRLAHYAAADGEEYVFSFGCMHCEEPSCMRVCPAGAITKGDGGIVKVNHDRCIGCKYCYQACPYGVPQYRVFGMDKCDCCQEAGVALGDRPHCVQACKVNALTYGKLEDLLATKIKRSQRVEGPTKPSYVVAY